MSLLGDMIKYENVPQGIPSRLVTSANGSITGIRAPNGSIQELNTSAAAKRNYFKKRAITVDDVSGTTASYVTSGVGTKTLSTTMARQDFNCPNALKLSDIANFASVVKTISGVKFTGTIDFWIYLSADPDLGFSITLGVSKDGFATSISWGGSQYLFFRAGWNRISLNIAEDGTTYQTGAAAPVVVGSTSFADTMTSYRLFIGNADKINPETGLPLDVYIGGLFYGGEGQANVILNWDDAFSDQWSIFNLFRAKGLTGSMAIIPPAVNFGGLTLSQLHEMYDWGWDIVNHTMQQSAGNLLLDSDAEVRRKIGVARDWMINNGFSRTANVLVWPENAYSDRLCRIAAELGVVLARGSRNTNTRTFQAIDNPLKLGSFGLGGKTLAQAKKVLDAAELYKCTVILTGHKITGTATVPAAGGAAPADGLYWNQSDFIALADDICDRMAAGTINNINYYQLLQECRV